MELDTFMMQCNAIRATVQPVLAETAQMTDRSSKRQILVSKPIGGGGGEGLQH